MLKCTRAHAHLYSLCASVTMLHVLVIRTPVPHTNVCVLSSTCTGLRPGQGTNRNEGLHRLLNSMNIHARYGPEFAAARLTRVFFQHNEVIQAAQEGRCTRTIQDYAAVTMANTTEETFGLLPEIAPSTTESTTPTSMQQMSPLQAINKIMTGMSTIGDSDEETPDTSLGSGPDLQVQARQHAIQALTYEHVYTAIKELASTLQVDYHRLPFLELADDIFVTAAASATGSNSSSLDTLIESFGLEKELPPLPPLDAAAKAVFQQLTATSSTPAVKAFLLDLIPGSRLSQDYHTFRHQLLLLLSDYIQTYELPITITPADQRQLALSILDPMWASTQFLTVILRCLATALHTPIILLTSSTDMPLLPYIPQEPPLSGLQPIYLGISAGQPHMVWNLLCPGSVPTTFPSDPEKTLPQPNIMQTNMQQATSTNADSTPPTSNSTPAPSMAHVQTVTAKPPTALPLWCNCGHSTRKQFACTNQPGGTSSRCPCFNSGVQCNSLCGCRNCQNTQGTNTAMLTTTPTQTAPTKCRCGESKKHITCSHQPGQRKSRCPCLKSGNACTPTCKCTNCANPYGISPGKPSLTASEIPRKRFALIDQHHRTHKRKAAIFLTDECLLQRTGPHTTIEYFLVLSIVEAEFGLLQSDALPADELLALYTAAIATITNSAPNLPVYPRTQDALVHLALAVKRYYTFTVMHGLTM